MRPPLESNPATRRDARTLVALFFGLVATTALLVFLSRYDTADLSAVPPGTAFSANPDDPFFCFVLRDPDADITAPRLEITIANESVSKLVAKGEEALRLELLETAPTDFVPAVLRHDGGQTRGRIRLKGDMTEHLETDCKWSYRVKVNGRRTILGMKVFSIHHPKARGYVYEWIFHELLKREGLVALRYGFLDVYINGNFLGLYAFEENFDKHLIENSGQREGPILKFDESEYWRNYTRKEGQRSDHDILLSARIDPFKKTRIHEVPLQAKYFATAAGLLDAFRRGKLRTGEVFATDKLAKYYAVAFLTGGVHAVRWHNLRFYYNPVTSLLEPIGFDAFDCKRHDEFPLSELDLQAYNFSRGLFRYWSYDGMNWKIFNDTGFFRQFMGELERIATRQYLDRLFVDIRGELRKNIRLLQTEFPFRFTSQPIYRNQQYIRDVLSDYAGVEARFVRSTETRIEVTAINVGDMPVEILSVSNEESTFAVDLNRVIHSEQQGHPVNWAEFHVPIERGSDVADLQLVYRIVGSGIDQKVPLLPARGAAGPRRGATAPRETAARPRRQGTLWQRDGTDHLEGLDFVATDHPGRRLQIRRGDWVVDRDLFFPPGYVVTCGPGTTLRLRNEANIISFSPLDFRGSPDDPIRISSENGEGQGVLVIRAGEASLLDNVIFSGLSNPNRSDYEITGAVTFYESNVAITNSRFVDARCEDALNIIRSGYSITDSRFDGTISDAFDSDFSNGTIERSHFTDIGGDAIDLSGGKVFIEGVVVQRAGDKGVSGGEDTRVHIAGIEISDSEVGVASKDGSQVLVEQATVFGSEIGLTAYEKKTEFGPARLAARDVRIGANDLPYMVEAGSEIIINGLPVRPYARKKQTGLFRWMRSGESIR